MKAPFILSAIMLISGISANAQVDRDAFKKVDEYVLKLGAMQGHGPRDIIDSFNKSRFDQLSLVRGIYDWIGLHVAYDCKGFHHPAQANNTASAVMMTRKATAEGYANLFQLMCNLARVQCITISGYAKWNYLEIGKTDKDARHVWNAVMIDNTWFVVDPTWAAGYTDINRREFTSSFTDAWFFTNRKQFVLTHFPDNEDRQFLDEPATKLSFSSSPVIFEGAIIGEVFPLAGQRGTIKGREGECKALCFDAPHPARIKNVKVSSHKGDLSPAEYHVFKNKLYVEVPFPAAGTYPVAIYINDSRGLTFKAVATKARKR